MRAMILAAGRGQRMGELTLTTPKPLLKVQQRSLIEHMIIRLQQAGVTEIIINVCYLAEKIMQALGNGNHLGVNISYSHEIQCLETGGGIVQALPFFNQQPFLVVSADIMTDFPFANLFERPFSSQSLAHLVMVDNPSFHPQGDFGFKDQWLDLYAQPKLTFANVGLYHPQLFSGFKPGHYRLAEILKPAIDKQLVTGEYYQGYWHNIGTPQDIAALS